MVVLKDVFMVPKLNSQQQQAVEYTKGAQLILAGAGSGKTRVLTHKVAFLIKEKHIAPLEILMVTFTNKAASEMKERIRVLLSLDNRNPYELPFAGTFHSLGAKMLRRHGGLIGLSPQYVIYDTTDQKEAIKEVMRHLDVDPKKISPYTALNLISQAKNELLNALEYLSYARGFYQEQIAKIYLEYERLLKKNQALDFDDLLLDAVRLLKTQPEIKEKYQSQFKHVLVDEYQDTNHAQYTFTKLLSDKWRNICVVGDASQSIYAWRGANFQNIINFQKDYPQTKVFHLEQNYRSTQIILDAAYAIISKNTSHPILKLWTEKKTGPKIELFSGTSEHEEALFIVSQIQSLSIPLSEVAVLYRTNAQSRVIEEALLHQGIPYTLVGGVRFYERKEIKDILAFLRLLINPEDSLSHKRIQKIGKKLAARFIESKEHFSLTDSSLELLDHVLEKTQYLELFNKENEEDAARLENIKELRSVASEFPDLADFLENVALVEASYAPNRRTQGEDRKDAVTLMTMHSAKGLEFQVVFMIGMEEGLFPHSRTLLDPSELEEERRLCYVGITRAKESLYLSHARRRLYFGTFMNNQISRFVSDIPENAITAAQVRGSDFLF